MAWTDRYVTTTGAGTHDGTSEANAFTLAEAITDSATPRSGYRYNIKDGTYSNTTTSRTFNGGGSNSAPNWWRGYNATIGDLDNDIAQSLSKPLITFTTGQFVIDAVFQIFSSLSIQGNGNAGVVICNSTNADRIHFHRCRIENTNTGADAYGMHAGSSAAEGLVVSDCWLKSGANAPWGLVLQDASRLNRVTGCVFRNCGLFLGGSTAGVYVVHKCTFDVPNSDGIFVTLDNKIIHISSCSFYDAVGDSIDFNHLGNGGCVEDCVFSLSGGYDINNSSGTTAGIGQYVFKNNLSHAPTSSHLNNWGDINEWHSQTDSSSPFVNAAGHDFSLATTSNANSNGGPKKFENESYTSYLSMGAVIPQGGTTTINIINKIKKVR